MAKKWWFLVVLIIVLAAIIFFIALNHKTVKKLPAGLVVVAPGLEVAAGTFPGAYAESGDEGTGVSAESDVAYGNCWQCPSDGEIIMLSELGIDWDSLSDVLVGNITNCTNKTELIQADCPSNEAVAVCGNGICDPSEFSESCPQDCPVTTESTTEEFEANNIQEQQDNEPEAGAASSGPTHNACTIDDRCVVLVGEGSDECSATNPCDQVEQVETSPPQASGLIYDMLKKLLGLP
jgi:hypothetical protein